MTRTISKYGRDRLDPRAPTGLIFCGMGGPDGPDTVEPFLRNLFADPEIFPLPRLLAGFVGGLIAKKRAPKVAASYAEIARDSVTPQLSITRLQVERIATALAQAGRTLGQWADAGRDPATTALFYVAHSMPESFIKKGDPYLDRTLETVGAVHARVATTLRDAGHGDWLDALQAGGREAKLVFQSKVGPIKWLGPEIAEETPRLAAEGLRTLFVQPVSFTCEHIETMLELGVELKETADEAGITEFKRGPALNLNAAWLESLTTLLLDEAFAPEVEELAADN